MGIVRSASHSCPSYAVDDRMGAEIVQLLPFLRRYALKLCGNAVDAEDLAQEAATRGWQARRSFHPGTDLRAWLTTILRNYHFSQCRKRGRFVPLTDGEAADREEECATVTLELHEACNRLTDLPARNRTAVIGAALGYSYAELAHEMRCPIGTAKSRVGRGRDALRDMARRHPFSGKARPAHQLRDGC